MENKYFTDKGMRNEVERLYRHMKKLMKDSDVLYKYECYDDFENNMDDICRLAGDISDITHKMKNLY